MHLSDIIGVSPYPIYHAADPVSLAISAGCGMVTQEIVVKAFRSPRRIWARDRANSVFPTPVGPARNNAPRAH